MNDTSQRVPVELPESSPAPAGVQDVNIVDAGETIEDTDRKVELAGALVVFAVFALLIRSFRRGSTSA